MTNVLGEKINIPAKTLEVFNNPHPDHNYVIKHMTDEFTCNCPKTGQPDFAHIEVEYVADKLCVELKSLKLYFWSFRNEGHFHEDVTNMIAKDLVKALQPRHLKVTGKFNIRGGLHTDIIVGYSQTGGWL